MKVRARRRFLLLPKTFRYKIIAVTAVAMRYESDNPIKQHKQQEAKNCSVLACKRYCPRFCAR